MLVNILETKCMDLEFITLLTVNVMRDRGMKVESKGMACILSGVVTQDVVSGIPVPLKPLYLN